VSEDFIALRGMVFFGFHGNKPEEKTLGQRFAVDVVVTADLSQAGASDALEDTVDYGKVYAIVKRIVEGPSLNLIEAVGEQICDEVMKVSDRIESVEAVVGKPAVPLPGSLDRAEVRLVRRRTGS
jgi:dihydroneopterin aldolase